MLATKNVKGVTVVVIKKRLTMGSLMKPVMIIGMEVMIMITGLR
jgi:hypothetical protein